MAIRSSRFVTSICRRLPWLGALGAVVAIWNSWFVRFGVRTAGDWGFYLKTTADTLRRHYFTIWLSDSQFGRVLIDSGQALTYAAYGWLSYYLGTSYALNERLIHLWPSVIVPLIAAYALVRYVLRDRLAAILGALVYSANTYHLALLTGHLTLAGAYGFAPLIVLLYLKAMATRRIRYVLWCALCLAVAGAYEPRVAYIMVGIVLLLALVHLLFVVLPKGWPGWRSSATLAGLYVGPIVLFMLLNMYWILGLHYAGGAAANSSDIATSLFGSQFFTTSEALTLFHPYWTGGLIEPFFIHPIPLYFWLMPLAAIASLILNRRSPALFFFAVLGMLGILLTKQADQPFPGLYHWLFTHVPSFNAFREASKFYLLTALAYAVLLPAFFHVIRQRYQRRWLTAIVFAGTALLFLPNLIPIATSRIGATFQPKTMPVGYATLNRLLDEPDYSRILWVPQSSRWSLANAQHPTVRASVLVDNTWADIPGLFQQADNATPTDEILSLLAQPYAGTLLRAAGIKYVVVPMRDVANGDNFYRSYNDDPSIFAAALAHADYLEPSRTHVNGFTIYQLRQQPASYFSAADTVYSTDKNANVAALYRLWQQLGSKGDLNTVTDGQQPYATDIRDLYGSITTDDLHRGTLPAVQPTAGKAVRYYADAHATAVTYAATSKQLQVHATSLTDSHATATQTVPLDAARSYVLANSTTLTPLARTGQSVSLGTPRDGLVLYTLASSNLIPRPTVDGALWQKEPTNCVPYGTGRAGVELDGDVDHGRPVFTLSAADHAACTGPAPLPVHAAATYAWHFVYDSQTAQLASYRFTFDDPARTVITKDMPVTDSSQHAYDVLITAPAGAHTVRVELMQRPSNQLGVVASGDYRDLSLREVTRVATITPASQLAPASPEAVPAVSLPAYPYHNLIADGDFAQGLWNKTVGDCDAYDQRPLLRMTRSSAAPQPGGHSLELAAQRHIACTGQHHIPVEAGATYMLQVSYQSPNATSGRIVVSLDGSNQTLLAASIPIHDHAWHTYQTRITMPSGAHTISFSVSAASDDSQPMYIVNRYTDFVLQRVPDVTDRYYTVATPTQHLELPKQITYQQVSNTSKEVVIQGARGPFMLLMSEQYHPGWQLGMRPAGIAAWLPWRPWSHLPASDHHEVNGFENGWLVDPAKLCASPSARCSRAADGSYTMHLTVLFAPQRWFNLGLIISGATAIGCLAVLAWPLLKRIRLPNRRKGVHYADKQRNR